MRHPERPMVADWRQRERIRTELDKNMLVEAAAGTGKTSSIVRRMVALLGEGKCKITGMVAVTFTRRAAAELRERFRSELEESTHQEQGACRTRLYQALENIHQGFIGTIHAFCSRLLRERPVEAGVDIAFEELDEEADMLLRVEAWNLVIARATKDENLSIHRQLDQLGIALPDLERAFAVYANYPDVDEWPLGQSHTPALPPEALQRALTEYLAHLSSLDPNLPEESGHDKLIPAIKKFVRQARHLDLDNQASLATLLETFEPNATIVKKKWSTQMLAQQEKDRFDHFQKEWVIPALYDIRVQRYDPILRIMHQAREFYDRLRRERGLLNFQDLLVDTSRLLEDHPHVRNYFRRRFTHILVDEFQDTDPIQAKVLLLLTTGRQGQPDWTRCRPSPGSLFVVGDPKQSIYRFRRADITIYNRIKEMLQTDGPPVTLSVNFRTSKSVLTWINRAFENMFPTSATDASPSYLALEKGRSHFGRADLEGVWTLPIPRELSASSAKTVAYEADFIAQVIRDALDRGLTVPRTQHELSEAQNTSTSGTDPNLVRKAEASDFMIITYTKNNLSVYAKSLQKYGLPHQVTGGSVLNQTEELRLLHTCLEAVVKPDNPVALLALLRSELFGISDRMLYAFKAIGGRFDYRTKCPQQLPEESAANFIDATSRLMKYSRWLDEVGIMPTIERMVSDLGLMARAAAAPDGLVRAGSLAKALELLRMAKTKTAGPTELAEYLGKLVDQTLTFDGMSALAEVPPAVRVMNLHKAKGLEAPVVFLADPNGGKQHDPNLHIDRSGRNTKAYMLVEKRTSGWHQKPIAHPRDWDQGSCLKQKELTFQQAERIRLLYVAATRAGSMLVITQKAKQQGSNIWSAFEPYLHDCPQIQDPGPQKAPSNRVISSGQPLFEQAKKELELRKQTIMQPTYTVRTARQLALVEEQDTAFVSGDQATWKGESGQGTEKGRVIHELLERALKDQRADLSKAAKVLVKEEQLDQHWAKEAVKVVRSVMKSELWTRAKKSQCWYTEAPFVTPWQETGPIDSRSCVLRGVIDLVFKEPDGWVVVDYKTDKITKKNLPDLIKKYTPQVQLYGQAWKKCANQPVKELGLFFTTPGEYIVV